MNEHPYTWINSSDVIRRNFFYGYEKKLLAISFFENLTRQRNFQSQYQNKSIL